MKNKINNAELVWKQLEDHLAPRLRLSVVDRAVYYHLLRHSRLEGKRRLRFSILWLARAIRLSAGPAREAVRRLVHQGALRLVERSKAGHLVEVRLPQEIRGVCLPWQATPANPFPRKGRPPRACLTGRQAANLEEADFLQTRALRQSIHSRERGLCFYCLRRIPARVRCLDHVVPRVQLGRNSYRNLVSCCVECNSQKSERPAGDFLRWLYRQRGLTLVELTARLRALDALAAGKLTPLVYGEPVPCRPGGPANPFPRKGRPSRSNPGPCLRPNRL